MKALTVREVREISPGYHRGWEASRRGSKPNSSRPEAWQYGYQDHQEGRPRGHRLFCHDRQNHAQCGTLAVKLFSQDTVNAYAPGRLYAWVRTGGRLLGVLCRDESGVWTGDRMSAPSTGMKQVTPGYAEPWSAVRVMSALADPVAGS